jgi:hypothetical protein
VGTGMADTATAAMPGTAGGEADGMGEAGMGEAGTVGEAGMGAPWR